MAMHKMFKGPNDVKSEMDAIKGLKKSVKLLISSGEPLEYILRGDSFAYDEAPAPFLFLGLLKGEWKKYGKDEKTAPDFSIGVCKVEKNAQGKMILKLQSKMGKGSKEKFLKALNKGLLKKAKVYAQFVESLETPAVAVADTANEEPVKNNQDATQNDNTEQATQLADLRSSLKSIQQGFSEFQALLKTPTVDGAFSKKEELSQAITTWENMNNNSGNIASPKATQFVQTAKQTLENSSDQVAQKETVVKLNQLNKLVKEFEKIPAENAQEGLEMQNKIEALMSNLEKIGLVA